VLFGVSFFALILKIVATVGPVYADYYTIDQMLKAKFRETQVEKLEVPKFKADFQAAMERNGIRDRKIEDLMVVKKDGNKLLVELDYEERRQFAANLDVVVHFKKSYSAEKPDGFTE
jgi:hypothetical protein